MAEALEETSNVDSDRLIDHQNFVCSQFEVFTHEYREFKEVPHCEEHSSREDSCCNSPKANADRKKHAINTSRKLQKAVLNLKRKSDNDVVEDMLHKMQEVADRLVEVSKRREAEFSAKTVPLPEFDAADMQLLLGEEEVPPSGNPLEEVEKAEQIIREQQEALLFEAELLLREYDHLINGVRLR